MRFLGHKVNTNAYQLQTHSKCCLDLICFYYCFIYSKQLESHRLCGNVILVSQLLSSISILIMSLIMCDCEQCRSLFTNNQLVSCHIKVSVIDFRENTLAPTCIFSPKITCRFHAPWLHILHFVFKVNILINVMWISLLSRA